MNEYIEKCDCYISSLRQGDDHVLGEATIIRYLGDNIYLADYNGVKCYAMYNPFAARYFVDDLSGVTHMPQRTDNEAR